MAAHTLSGPYQIGTFGFIQSYVVTMRPYLMFVSGITGIVGLSFADRVPPAEALLVSLASFLSYGFGQALTDCFQTDTDALSAPYRPLIQGVVSKRQVLSISLTGQRPEWAIPLVLFYSAFVFVMGVRPEKSQI